MILKTKEAVTEQSPIKAAESRAERREPRAPVAETTEASADDAAPAEDVAADSDSE